VVNVQHVDVQFSLVREKQPRKKCAGGWLPFWRNHRQAFGALKDVSFEVYEGDILGIIGPNGAGKTTLCRVLAGILKADRGEVTSKGEITALLTFGAGFNEQLSGRDNVFLNGMMLGIAKQELVALYPGIVEFSGLARFMDHPLKHYSQGMRARLGFSIAAMIKPDVFIIDEALSVGDVSFSERASGKIQELIAGAKAVIMVSHQVELLKKVCTKALWLAAGEVRSLGAPAEVIEQYQRSVQR
jgi:teichoic acid transport system ATP-binding protein